MDAIPLDVLRLIFEHCVEELIYAKTGLRHPIDYILRSTPFALATTCSRWRKLALAAPELWTYILVTDEDDWNAIQRVYEGISRSKSQLLDVTIVLHHCDESRYAAIAKLVSTVLLHGNRIGIRSMHLRLPYKIDRKVCMAALKGPTPQLASLLVCYEPPLVNADHNNAADRDLEDPDDKSSFYLPYAPRLEILELEDTHMSCSPLYCRLDTLRDLTLWSGTSLDQFLDLAKCAFSTLQKLKLAMSWDIPAGVQPVTLPHLTSLTLQGSTPLLHLALTAPRLRHLGLDTGLMSADMSLVIDHFASTVTALEIIEGSAPEDVHVLQAFRQADTVTFTAFRNLGPITPVDWDLVLKEVATSSPPIWPKLASLHLGEGTGKALGDGLLNLVRTRSLQTNNEVDPASTERPAKLAAVELVGSGAPEWLCSSVAHLLARAKV
ncbi:hypothetical protein EXIGLDRAFT_833327 [Exidia glandulosa HHB12029]|uniref:F-box domain-containing protein n=1 Tax=Exidia glandulosa HHB12029 TaxID=1314781 RepID=A0A165KUE7_EXIGL|nr:hypothetical protein EXIGLDRAFT_833327 [Exidia glandulosa HHB12029]